MSRKELEQAAHGRAGQGRRRDHHHGPGRHPAAGRRAWPSTVARAYRESVAKQTAAAARQEVAALDQRQEQLARRDRRPRPSSSGDPGNDEAAGQPGRPSRISWTTSPTRVEAARDAASRAATRAETVKESATVPDDPAQPKPLRNAVLGAMLGLVVSAGLAWWLNGRRMQNLRLLESLNAAGRGEAPPELTAKGALAPARRFRRDSRQITVNGSPAGNGSASGIADFDQVATSIQQLFRSLDGPPQQALRGEPPQHGGRADRPVVPGRPGGHPAQDRRRSPDHGQRRSRDGVGRRPRPCRLGADRERGVERAAAGLPGRAAVAGRHRPGGERRTSRSPWCRWSATRSASGCS